MNLASSEVVQCIFEIGAGASKMDLTAISLAQVYNEKITIKN